MIVPHLETVYSAGNHQSERGSGPLTSKYATQVAGPCGQSSLLSATLSAGPIMMGSRLVVPIDKRASYLFLLDVARVGFSKSEALNGYTPAGSVNVVEFLLQTVSKLILMSSIKPMANFSSKRKRLRELEWL
jgi:hypothetical protein